MSSHPWIAKYPEGIPAQITEDRPESLLELFNSAFKHFGSREAFENLGKMMTYQEINLQSDFFAAYLQNKVKVQKRDRIAIQMPNNH